MQFFAVASAILATALAVPAPQTTDCPNPAHCGTPPDPATYDNIDITDYTFRYNNEGIQGVSFTLSGKAGSNIGCSMGPVASLPANVVSCSGTKYSFGLIKSPSNNTESVGIAIYHELGPAYGDWGEGEVPTYCRAGGNGIDDRICQQVGAYTLVIQ